MKKRIITCLCSALLCLTALSGCSNENGQANGDSNEGGKNTIKIAISGSAQEMEIRKKMGEMYVEENPDVDIEWVDIGSERFQKTMTLISSGSAPDLLYINEYVYAFAEKNVLEPLDEYIANDSEFKLDRFYDNLIEPLKFDGKLYGLPQEVSPFVIYYNKDMFEANGIPLPTDEWTYEEFIDAAKKLTKAEEKVYGYSHKATTWYDQQLLWMIPNGVEIYSEDLKSTKFDSQEMLYSLNLLNDMVVKNKISPDPASIQAMGKGFDALFRNGKVAMEAAGLWMIPTYDADPLPFNWDVVKIPRGTKNQETKAGVLNWSISKDSKNKDIAWDILKFFTSDEAMKLVAESRMALPAVKGEEVNNIILNSGEIPKNIKAFVEAASEVNLTDQLSSRRNEMLDAMGKQLDSMLNGNQSPEDTQKKIVEETNKILGQ